MGLSFWVTILFVIPISVYILRTGGEKESWGYSPKYIKPQRKRKNYLQKPSLRGRIRRKIKYISNLLFLDRQYK